jgi:sugar phosphate permease
MTTVNSWFIRKRGLAFAVTQASHNVGTAIGAPAIAFLVQEFGWRTASVASAIALWLLVLPTSLMIVGSPEKLGMRPDGAPAPPPGSAPPLPSQDFMVKEALKTKAYWMLALATTLRLFVINTLSIHMVPIFVWKGVSEPEAAIALGMLALLGIPTRILIGITGDRLKKNYVIAGGIVVGIAGLLQLLFVQEQWSVWVFVAVFSIMEGVIPLNWAMIGDFFGRAKFATLRGVMGLIYTWGAVIGPVAAGFIFDETDTYTPVLWGMIGFFVAAAAAFLFLRPPVKAAQPV